MIVMVKTIYLQILLLNFIKQLHVLTVQAPSVEYRLFKMCGNKI